MSDRPQNATPEPVEDDLPEQMRVRRSKRERLLEEGGAFCGRSLMREA